MTADMWTRFWVSVAVLLIGTLQAAVLVGLHAPWPITVLAIAVNASWALMAHFAYLTGWLQRNSECPCTRCAA